MLSWQFATLEALTSLQAFAMFRLRQDVFIIEQTCLYPDLDELDLRAWHLLGWTAETELHAYLRIIAPGVKYAEPAIGRVTTHRDARRGGLGRALMREGIERTEALFPGQGIRLSAQTYLIGFYETLGFATVGKPYLEDDIEHIEMVRAGCDKRQE